MTFRRAGWVLVGGRSSRMGTDKALLQVDGSQPLALLAAAMLKDVTGSVTLVGDPVKYGNLGLPVVPDLRPDCGPLAGIESALNATTAEWNVILACDIPGVPLGFIADLFELTDGADAVVPQHANGKIEPLCALYHRRCLEPLTACLNRGTRRVTDALGALTLRYLQVTDGRAFRNLNTPGDLDQYRNG